MSKSWTAIEIENQVGFEVVVHSWLKDYAPQEVHDDEHEKFLIIEGTCDIIVGNEINQLVAGDYFAIPLHKNHIIKVTSSQPCKVILQRVAA